ncbi:positive regulator of chea protein activity (chew) [hydrocarbon metagenome]|uniref:Positive regulator of chea protein activity (Chew) n=1 Tax=hydrocarbon metagenome TaxID=938273 RepID=A0A0W8F2P7_9ZZZZ
MVKPSTHKGAEERSPPGPAQENAGSLEQERSRRDEQGGREKGLLQVVEFLLGKERYAVDLFDVKEVVEYTTITKLPNTASYMKGIIDLRGEITTIIDLKERLRIPTGTDADEENSRIIVLDEKITKAKTGIMVDDVLSVSTFDRNDIDSTSATDVEDDTAILGIIKKKVKDKDHEKNELIIWIDIKYLLRDIGEGMTTA